MSADKRFWEKPEYGEIVGIEPRPDGLVVEFANGDRVEAPLDSLGADAETRFELDEDGSLLAVGPAGEREIDWMALRARSDPAFAAELRERDAQESRRIGRRLRVLRENRGFSQKAVAGTAGMSPPQLAKIEKGESDLRISTLSSVLRALGADFTDIAGPDVPEISTSELVKNGTRSKAPKEILERIAAKVDPRHQAEVLARGFGWDAQALLRGAPENPELDFQVAFKARSPEKDRHSPILRLARTISEITVVAAARTPVEPAVDPGTIRGELGEEIDLRALAEWAWRVGIAVIPMSGPGFSAAAWRVDERPVAVLKAKKDYEAHWLFELAHELGHVVLGHVNREKAIVDVDEPRPVVEGSDRQEKEATEFALSLLIPDRERILAEIKSGSGQTLDEQRWNFKKQVQRAAKREGIGAGLLGFVAAFGLPEVARDQDRWGSATNLAKAEDKRRAGVGGARAVVQAVYAEQVDLDAIPEIERALIEAVVLE